MQKIVKRNGAVVAFNREKITAAILAAFESCGEGSGMLARLVCDSVIAVLAKKFSEKNLPGVEDIQDAIEEALILRKLEKAAKAYILYRQKRAEIREIKKSLGVWDDLKLSVNALSILKETPAQVFRRTARAAARAEKKSARKTAEEEFYQIMANLEFLPDSPSLLNAGGQFCAWFGLPLEDSLESIFGSLKDMALIQQSGGRSGFSFSRLRPRGEIIKSSRGSSSGPVSFIKIFNSATEVLKQGGGKSGPNFALLSVDHPDILDFISAKNKEGELNNFDLAVAVSAKFMRAVAEDQDFDLINPQTGKPVKTIRARSIFDLLATLACRSGSPGVSFAPTLLRPYESCLQGAINLAKMTDQKTFNWEKLKKCVQLSVQFLDNLIEISRYPLAKIRKITKANRKIGLGVMGWAEALIQLGIPYNSDRAVSLAGRIARFINDEARQKGKKNLVLTAIYPSETISAIANVTPGIEPLGAVALMRQIMPGTSLLEVNPQFEQILRQKDLFSERLIMEAVRAGSIQPLAEIPIEVRELFVTTADIQPEWQVKMLSAFQRFVDQDVVKTITLPFDAASEDVRNIFLLAHKLKCKSVRVSRREIAR